MKKISDALREKICAGVTTIVNCWKITLTNGKVLGFTDNAMDIEFEGFRYIASSGFRSSAIESELSLSVDNLEINGIIDSEIIKREDILNGVYDNAYIEVFIVDYTALEAGKLVLKAGYIGEVTLLNNQFVAEVRGIEHKLNNTIGKLFSPTCRAEFGDHQCKKKQSKFMEHGRISKIISPLVIESSDLNISNPLYSIGTIKFLSGAAVGLILKIRQCKFNRVIFAKSPNRDLKIGDNFIIYGGCDKQFSTCCKHYNNAINFRGEPNIPGSDEMYKTAGTYR